MTPSTERPSEEERLELRLGLLLDRLEVPRWFRRALEETLAIPGVRLVVVVLNRPNGTFEPTRSWSQRVAEAVYIRYGRWDRRRHVPAGEDALEEVSIEDLLGEAARLEVEPRRTRYSDRFTAKDRGRVASQRPDLLVRKGFRILRGPILDLPRFGVWSYHHGDPELYRGGPAGFWETLQGKGIVGSVLQRLTDELDAGEFLARTISPASDESVAATRNTVYWDSSSLLPRCVRRLVESGDPRHHTGEGIEPRGPVYRQPGTWTTLRMIARSLHARARRSTRLTTQHWTLRVSPPSADGKGSELHRRTYVPVEGPAGHFWADPCLFQDGERLWLFFEDYEYASGIGVIRCVEVDPSGRPVGAPQLVIGGEEHCSNPLVFRLDGRIWMLPETSRSRRVQIFEAVRFPNEWRPSHVLLPRGDVVDPVLLRHQGLYWLLGTEAVPGGSRVTNLNAWHAPTLEGPWREHSWNPVVSDCRAGRAAGRILERSGTLLRPAQDGSHGYGRAIRFMELVELSPQAYRERPVDRIDPEELGAAGTHTFTRAGDWIAVDVRHLRFRRAIGAGLRRRPEDT